MMNYIHFPKTSLVCQGWHLLTNVTVFILPHELFSLIFSPCLLEKEECEREQLGGYLAAGPSCKQG